MKTNGSGIQWKNVETTRGDSRRYDHRVSARIHLKLQPMDRELPSLTELRERRRLLERICEWVECDAWAEGDELWLDVEDAEQAVPLVEQVLADEAGDLAAHRVERAVLEDAQDGELLRQDLIAERARRPIGEVIGILDRRELVLQELAVHVVANGRLRHHRERPQQLVERTGAPPGHLDEIEDLLENEWLRHSVEKRRDHPRRFKAL